MLEALGNCAFLCHQTQSFDQSETVIANIKEERNFLNNLKIVPLSSVSQSANIFCSETIYKLEQDYDRSLRLKTRIALHEIEDSEKPSHLMLLVAPCEYENLS